MIDELLSLRRGDGFRTFLPWLATLAMSAGCGAPPAPPPDTSVAQPAAAGKQADVETRETWDVYYLGAARIGYGQTRVAPRTDDGVPCRETIGYNRITLRRFGQVVQQELTLTSVETLDGRLRHGRSEMASGSSRLVTEVRAEGERLKIRTDSGGLTQESEIPWDASWGGFFATESSLESQPMQPGERRTLQALMPVFNQVAEIRLEAGPYEETSLLNGTHRLLRIRSQVVLDGQPALVSTLWTDQTGQTLKSVVEGINQVAFRTTRAGALEQSEPAEFDLGRSTLVRVPRPLRDAHRTAVIVYRATLEDGDPSSIFVSGPLQTVRPLGPHVAEITVRRLTPDEPAARSLPDSQRPRDNDLAPNALIQSTDERVVTMAGSVAPGETDPWRLAQALERHVHQAIRAKDFSQALASAAEVARSLEGDCTEHAVLLAALCRARRIPARVAIGLVYYPAEQGFAYHMWSEAWIGDRWVPLDGTLGMGGIGGGHLKLAESNLTGASALSVFLPVVQILGRLQLEVAEVQ